VTDRREAQKLRHAPRLNELNVLNDWNGWNGLEFTNQHYPVAHRQQHIHHPRVVANMFIKRIDGFAAFVLRVEDATAAQHIVHDDEASGTAQPHASLVICRILLYVGVNVANIERTPNPLKRFGRRAENAPLGTNPAARTPQVGMKVSDPERANSPAAHLEQSVAGPQTAFRSDLVGSFRLGLVLDDRVDVVVRVEERCPDAAPVLGFRLLLEPNALCHELLLHLVDGVRREPNPRFLTEVRHVRVVVRRIVVHLLRRGEWHDARALRGESVLDESFFSRHRARYATTVLIASIGGE